MMGRYRDWVVFQLTQHDGVEGSMKNKIAALTLCLLASFFFSAYESRSHRYPEFVISNECCYRTIKSRNERRIQFHY